MKATTHQKAGPRPAASLCRMALAGGLALAALSWLAGPAPAEEVAQAQDDVEPRMPGLDPWNVEIRGGPKWDPRNAPPQLKARGQRHIEFLQAGVPVEYRSQRNPYPNVTKAIDAGREVYEANCKSCHGPRGRGDGDAGLDLIPSPALLTELSKDQGAADEYLLWTVAEGGQPFGTAMPAFKDRLNEDQTWQVISYLRAGLPPAQP
ncbi:cytochrome c [Pelagibius sp. CAU 1746]|uniref:c-type cytochrome n=1 Tax=Pelagibius sp. CAU 1746 TaxID=3140370 RepID=UPI00325AF220